MKLPYDYGVKSRQQAQKNARNASLSSKSRSFRRNSTDYNSQSLDYDADVEDENIAETLLEQRKQRIIKAMEYKKATGATYPFYIGEYDEVVQLYGKSETKEDTNSYHNADTSSVTETTTESKEKSNNNGSSLYLLAPFAAVGLIYFFYVKMQQKRKAEALAYARLARKKNAGGVNTPGSLNSFYVRKGDEDSDFDDTSYDSSSSGF